MIFGISVVVLHHPDACSGARATSKCMFLDSIDAYIDFKKNLDEEYFFILEIFHFENFENPKKLKKIEKSKNSGISKNRFSDFQKSHFFEIFFRAAGAVRTKSVFLEQRNRMYKHYFWRNNQPSNSHLTTGAAQKLRLEDKNQ